ncbi:hypothetical protein M011DRAFT_465175 [Sporormia fimetaria CBS 119925]|uniref:Uncharacterized protein n=1 Tax=Sporormia fimetaria CBS 119925 TaxID=1340428 RepID=A0A6A6VIJ4_9PLEO|nr:hypothetical protein M011DRAFT_465175 [Sporormia fimetaria CBS 119925]
MSGVVVCGQAIIGDCRPRRPTHTNPSSRLWATLTVPSSHEIKHQAGDAKKNTRRNTKHNPAQRKHTT